MVRVVNIALGKLTRTAKIYNLALKQGFLLEIRDKDVSFFLIRLYQTEKLRFLLIRGN